MKISIEAKSSSGQSYIVDFIRDNDRLTVFCNCAAGEWGKFCKHKWGLLSGDREMLASEANEEKLRQIEPWVKDSAFLSLYNEVYSLENELGQIKAQIKKAKKAAEKKMIEGF